MAGFKFDQKSYDEWNNNTHIPDDVMAIVNGVCAAIGCEPVEEEVIVCRNRGGWIYEYIKGFTLTYKTMSYDEGPTTNYAPTLMKWIESLGFSIESEYEDEPDECRYECYGSVTISYDASGSNTDFEYFDGTDEEYDEFLERQDESLYGDY